MHRIVVAFRAFFRVLFNRQVAAAVEQALAAPAAPASNGPTERAAMAIADKPAARAPREAPARNAALTLLAALQREARFVDFIQEPISAYGDAQIGAAVRDIHRDCAKLLERVFALQPIEAQSEGAEMQVPGGFDPARIRLVGNVTGQPPFRGRLCHHGWQATRCELPEWTGAEQSLFVVAPAEVELQ